MKTIKPVGYKKLAFGIMLACGVSGAANATTSPINNIVANDLFLNVWDPTTTTSYAVDLGVSLPAFFAEAGSSLTFNLDSTFSNWVATVPNDTLTFNIAAANVVPPQNTTADAYLLSFEAANSPFASDPTMNLHLMNINQGNIESRIGELNGSPELIYDPTGTNQAYFNYFGGVEWGIGEAIASQIMSSTVGNGGLNQLYVEYLNTPGTNSQANSVKTPYEQLNGYFSINTSNSTLNWTSTAVSAVPVPGAVWLFLGGLMTVLGLQKRKSGLAA